MSHVYSFAVVPFDLDGDTHQLHRPDTEVEGEFSDEFIDGAKEIDGVGVSMNGMFTYFFNEVSEGYWQAFLVGGPLKWDSNGRFIVLDKRRQADIPLLKRFAEKMKGTAPYDLFKELFAETERVLANNKNGMVALVIY